MNYNEFKNKVREYFESLLGETYKVEIKQVIKNNDTKLDALTILGVGDEISPTLYLREFYEQYKNGMELEEVLLSMYRFYKKYKTNNNIDVSLFGDRDRLREKIVFKLINKEANKELLEDVPYIAFLDFAIVFYVIVEMGENEYATTLIHKNQLEFWDFTVDELVEVSAKNTPRILKADLVSMEDMAKELLLKGLGSNNDITSELESGIDEFLSGSVECANKMYILTNKYRTNGAACLLYENVLKMFSDYIERDVYIIPSSIHEVILVPDYGMCEEEMNSMVVQVNSTELEKSEILSEHIYKYVRDTEEILMK